jgi:hypothetical protein
MGGEYQIKNNTERSENTALSQGLHEIRFTPAQCGNYVKYINNYVKAKDRISLTLQHKKLSKKIIKEVIRIQ